MRSAPARKCTPAVCPTKCTPALRVLNRAGEDLQEADPKFAFLFAAVLLFLGLRVRAIDRSILAAHSCSLLQTV